MCAELISPSRVNYSLLKKKLYDTEGGRKQRREMGNRGGSEGKDREERGEEKGMIMLTGDQVKW